MKIPVLNIYYMLSYSWNSLEESGIAKVEETDFKSLLDLFGRVLVNGSRYLIKKGIDRNYNHFTVTYPGIKGKMNIGESVKKSLLIRGKTICEIDELDYDVIHNQIIKTTLYNLLRNSFLDNSIRLEVKQVYNNFHKVSLITLSPSCFRQVQLHRNIKHYYLLIKICKYIFENSTINESNGSLIFKDFTRDDKKMARLFESFLYNFYRKELSSSKVFRESINWNLESVNNSNASFLPKMLTDISIFTRNDQKIIIDAKYYSKTLVTHFESESFHSANLYQLFSYIINQQPKLGGHNCMGILLYPQVDKKLHEEFIYNNHKIIIKTVNLNNTWSDIEIELLALINDKTTVHTDKYSA